MGPTDKISRRTTRRLHKFHCGIHTGLLFVGALRGCRVVVWAQRGPLSVRQITLMLLEGASLGTALPLFWNCLLPDFKKMQLIPLTRNLSSTRWDLA